MPFMNGRGGIFKMLRAVGAVMEGGAELAVAAGSDLLIAYPGAGVEADLLR